MKALILPPTLWILVVASIGSAGPLDDISRRDKLYDLAVRGEEVFVVGYPGLLLHSSDRGASFEALDPGTRDALYAIDMIDNGKGVIAGRSGRVLITRDEGKSWLSRETGTKEHLFDVEMTSSGKIWAVGNFGTIIHSPDGGDTWKKQEYDATLPRDDVSGESIGTISTAEEENSGAEQEARLNGVAFYNDRKGWVVGEFGMVLYTEDGGASWKRQVSASGKLLFGVEVVGEDHLVAVGSEGTFMETRDAGRTWLKVETGVDNHILGICTVGEMTYLVGTQGLVLIRDPSGGFKKLKVGFYTWYNAVRFIDPNLGFIVGGRGYMLKSVDRGLSWKRMSGS